ncbi:Scr1 family TA system antitoxin-like transcriptional regulator [Glycomyces buryatensis]|uniref:DUF5753 domain-containing protein n=1 Tax=Glycomyces buryatensis TaxID=2570927 RepID=A0A4S8QBG7_9ACTN|nr:Scr1 family TA system antitoxin-like transcriptional regulator [Glycomyces buryatensis]THV37764.1 hypothetical protein FAB82_20200 [Glycomyces buryatensis]
MSLPTWYVCQGLADLMQANGVDDHDVGAMLDYSYQTISNWRKGAGQPSKGDVREFFHHYGNGDEEAMLYMQQVVRSKKADHRELEADPRFNALMLERADRHYRRIIKWAPTVLPGTVQERAYHDLLQEIEGTTDDVSEFGWTFKERRVTGIEARIDKYEMVMIIGDAAFLWLNHLSAAERSEQIEHLRYKNNLPGWNIGVMAQPHSLGGNFDLYLSQGSLSAGPDFVFTEINDRSWCIEEQQRVRLYHDLTKPNRPRATPLEEFLNAERDRLA